MKYWQGKGKMCFLFFLTVCELQMKQTFLVDNKELNKVYHSNFNTAVMQKSLQMDFQNYNFCGHGVHFYGHRVHFAAQMLLQSLSMTSIPHNLIETPLKKCSLFMDLGKVLEMRITFVIIKIQCKLNLLTATLLKKKKKKENRFFSNSFLIKKIQEKIKEQYLLQRKIQRN